MLTKNNVKSTNLSCEEKKNQTHPRSPNLLCEYTVCEALNDAKG